MATLIGSAEGIHAPGSSRAPLLAGHRIDGLARGDAAWWVLTDGANVWNIPDGGTASRVAAADDVRLNCLLPRRDEVLVGAEEAQLFHIAGSAEPGVAPTIDEPFQRAPGRAEWYTPWGGPPDVRSMAADVDGSIYLNVHVGGVLRFAEDDPVWRDTMDIHADVHEVIAHGEVAATALAATARGLAVSRDGTNTWSFHTEGLHAHYCRAVAVSGDRVYVSASRSNRGESAAVYRTDLTGRSFERCDTGLPEWFSTNINTRCLQALGDTVVIGDADGTVYQSDDTGDSWSIVAEGLPSVRCIGVG